MYPDEQPLFNEKKFYGNEDYIGKIYVEGGSERLTKL